jgi:succinoglycan biosynthesis protein ExoA
MPGPDVSVLVPILNERRWLPDSARSMLDQRFDGEIEFLFIDGGSTDGTKALLEELDSANPRLRVLNNPSREIPQALNIGLGEARGEFIVRMDAHSMFPPDYVRCAVERLRKGDVEWVAGPVVPVAVGRWSRWVAGALATSLGQGGSLKWAGRDGDDPGEPIELDAGVFAGAWRRSLLERYGGWDEEFAAAEDAELAARMMADGCRIVSLPELAARYIPRDSPWRLARQYWRIGFYRAKTVRRHPHVLRRAHLVAPPLIAVTLLALTSDRRISLPARLGLAGYAVALLTASLKQTRRGERGDAVGIVAGLITMHYSWALGFLAGCARFGLPIRAMLQAVRLGPREPTGYRGTTP